MNNTILEFAEKLDFGSIETKLRNLLKKVGETLLQLILSNVIESESFLLLLKLYGGRIAYRFKEYRKITITLYEGQKIEVNSPFFLKTTAKRGCKKRGPNNRGRHLGLEVFGIQEKMSPLFLSRVCRQALLCPSFKVASSILVEDGINIRAKRVHSHKMTL